MPWPWEFAFLVATIAVIVVWILYLIVYQWLSGKWEDRVNEQMRLIRSQASMSDQRQIIKALSPGSRQREQSMITMGTIFIAAAFIILAPTTSDNLPFPTRSAIAVASPLVYSWWLRRWLLRHGGNLRSTSSLDSPILSSELTRSAKPSFKHSMIVDQ